MILNEFGFYWNLNNPKETLDLIMGRLERGLITNEQAKEVLSKLLGFS